MPIHALGFSGCQALFCVALHVETNVMHEVISLSEEVNATDDHKRRARPNQDVDDMTPFYSESDVKQLAERTLPAVAKIDIIVMRCVPSLHVGYWRATYIHTKR